MEIDGKGLTGLASDVLAQAGIAGLILFILALGTMAYLVLRAKGVLPTAPKTPSPDVRGIENKIDVLGKRFGDFDKRLVAVEHDLEDRPTRAELNDIRIAQVRQEERTIAMDKKIEATLAGNLRIQEFLYDIAGKKNR